MYNETILFSGRFDKPHGGHFLTIKELSKNYKKVLIVVLDYKESYYPLCLRIHLLEKYFEDYENVETAMNKIHFGKITKEELSQFKFDVYGSGNMDVLKHIELLGIKCVYVPRTFDTAASDDIRQQKLKDLMKE